jgi:MFS family permease
VAQAPADGIRALVNREWVVPFTLLTLLIVIDAADNNAIGPITGLIRNEFSLSATEVGLYAGVAALCSVLLLIPAGEFIKRAGIRTSATISPLTIVAGALISLVSPAFLLLVVGRSVVMVGVRASTLVGMAGATSVAPPPIMSTLWAFINSALAIGGILGSVWLGGSIGAAYGWRAVFAVQAVITLGIAVILFFFLRMPQQAGHASGEPAGATTRPIPFDPYRSAPIWLLGIATGLAATGTSLTLAFGAVIAADQWGLGPQFIGDAYGLGYLVSLPFMFALAALVDRTHRRKLALTIGILAGLAGAVLAIPAVGDTTPAGSDMFRVAVILFVSCSVATIALFFAAAPMFVPRGASLGPVYGLMTTLSLSWAVVLPVLAGAIRDATGDFSDVFMMIAVAELTSLSIVWAMRFRPTDGAVLTR